MEQLRSLLSVQGDDRLRDTQESIEAAANGLKQRAQNQLDAANAAKTAAVRQADAQLRQAMGQVQQQLERAMAEADRVTAAAERGLEQASAMGNQALASATETRDAALKAAVQARAEAKNAFDTAVERAKKVADDSTKAAEAVLADAQQALADVEARVASAAQQAQDAVDHAAAAAIGLDDEAVALGQDALERLVGALTWPSGILSLVAAALVWLKGQCFPAVDELQIIWHEPADGPTGLGLQWLKDDTMLRLVYRPAVPPAVSAGTLLVETKGTGEFSFEAPGNQISLTFKGHPGQRLIVGKGAPGPAPGTGEATLVLEFGASEFSKQFGPLTALLEKPKLTTRLAHVESWTYDVTLEFPRYGATLRLSDLLRQAGLSVPTTVPSIDEFRSLKVGVAGGRFFVREGASA